MRAHSFDASAPSGKLLLAGTPIGDSRYASDALRKALLSADIIAAEDTRKFVQLCHRIDIHPTARMVSFFEGNETERTPGLIEDISRGSVVVLVTDAGMPSISDPGYRLVTACLDSGLLVSAVPGPSAVLTALAVSGLATDRFCFEGFLPRKAGARRTRLSGLRTEQRTMVFFEAPHRLSDFLDDAISVFGRERRSAIARELTKPHEEVIRGPLCELADWSTGEVRGEVTVVIAGATPEVPSMDDLVVRVEELVAQGMKRTAAIGQVARETGADRHVLYDEVCHG
ncbi:MAG: 16S rRNA (cytidine(1402)-2'-O)-methyltransferase [Propionibacteriaceae bacterium]|nr:16S rRNA (cytidine(1402)-2'-O)-methyltransferase [Propionibacteriaceae bacterium]